MFGRNSVTFGIKQICGSRFGKGALLIELPTITVPIVTDWQAVGVGRECVEPNNLIFTPINIEWFICSGLTVNTLQDGFCLIFDINEGFPIITAT